MDHYKAVVLRYLQSDRSVFVHTECCVGMHERSAQRWLFDAVAIDLRHRAVYVCAVAYRPSPVLKRIKNWAQHWEAIKEALHSECKLPESWRIHAWIFVPREAFEELDAALEDLRRVTGCPFKVKLTALEDIQPWQVSDWAHTDELANATVRGGELL